MSRGEPRVVAPYPYCCLIFCQWDKHRFANYQQAIQWLVQLAFTLIASATIIAVATQIRTSSASGSEADYDFVLTALCYPDKNYRL